MRSGGATRKLSSIFRPRDTNRKPFGVMFQDKLGEQLFPVKKLIIVEFCKGARQSGLVSVCDNIL